MRGNDLRTFHIGDADIDVDIGKTRQLTAGIGSPTDECCCAGCRNFVLAASAFPAEAQNFFSQLGMDIKRPAEIYALYAEDEGKTLHYGGFWHLVGSFRGSCGGLKLFPLCKRFSAGFTDEISLPGEGHPAPTLQLEADFTLPWVLDEKNPY